MEDYFLQDEPTKIEKEHLPLLLKHMEKVNASDIYIHSGEQVLMDIHGRKRNVTKKPTTTKVVEGFAKAIAGDDAIIRLNSKEAIDKDYEQKYDGNRFRYRINLTNTMHKGQSSIQITIRSIPVEIPKLINIGLSNNHFIYKNFFPKQGLVLVTGPTGSGKSTLMAACIAEKVQEPECHRIFNTYEAPIEFIYDDIKKPSARVYQTPVPDGIKNFEIGISNSLRRKPEVIVVGELRDCETISAAVDAGQTGHLVIGTAHTTGVAATVRRLITVFGAEERDGRQADILEQLHMIVAQNLLKTTDGKRIAVRETLVFTQDMKDSLLEVNPLRINVEIRKILKEHNEGMILEAKKYLDEGIINQNEYNTLAGHFTSN